MAASREVTPSSSQGELEQIHAFKVPRQLIEALRDVRELRRQFG
jgi:hypothetical protein